MTVEGKIGFIGAGNMASAILAGLLESSAASADRLGVFDPDSARRDAIASKGVTVFESNAELAAWADALILATKPQVVDTVLRELGDHAKNTLVISIAAGVSCARIESFLPSGTRVIRTMPNTPALVGKGATAISAGTHATDSDLAFATAIFESVGIVVRVEEKQIDAVTGLSGSGPAYVFAMIEAMAEAGEKVGLPSDVSLALTQQTVLGAATLLSESDDGPAALRKKVSSPGGTTVAGLAALKEAGFQQAIGDGIEAATARSIELGKNK